MEEQQSKGEVQKVPYVCGPLTELPPGRQEVAKRIYSTVADICEEVWGVRAFVPHEHCDPIVHADLSPPEVDAIERPQVCERTSLLIVVALDPSWGGGIEVEMCNHAGVKVLLVWENGRKLSRLLRGNPAIEHTIVYREVEDLYAKLREALHMLRYLHPEPVPA